MDQSNFPRVREEFERYIADLVASCRARPAIVGLVLMGSTADRERVDEWSDHDFAVIAEGDAVEALRNDLSWLPRADRIVAVAREHHDGFKAICASGAAIEFAVTDLAGLSTFYANSWEIAYGTGALATVMGIVSEKPLPNAENTAQRDMTVLLAALLIGVGRDRRGERLSASGSVRGLALDHLLLLLARALTPDSDSRLDTLDQRRRFESVHPLLGSQLVNALASPVEECAKELLTIAERELAQWDDYPTAAVTAVRSRLGWV